MPRNRLLTINDLSVSLAVEDTRATILDCVNLYIDQGEIVGLVGESGCGKTTLARAILGILPRSSRIDNGSILLKDRDLRSLSGNVLADEIRGSEITFVPQNPFTSFSPLFPIGAQMRDLMKYKSPRTRRLEGSNGERSDQDLVIDMLNAVQLRNPAELLRRYPHELSGGQRQRIMIAMALLPEPSLIIADEPTTALDVSVQAQILLMLRKLASARRASVLFTTHDLATAYEICDRIVVMYAGQEVEDADVRSFFEHPRHPYTNRLLESVPRGTERLKGIPGEVPSLLNPPSGCRFHPRCTVAQARCFAERPPVGHASEKHSFRCFHPVHQVEGAIQ